LQLLAKKGLAMCRRSSRAQQVDIHLHGWLWELKGREGREAQERFALGPENNGGLSAE